VQRPLESDIVQELIQQRNVIKSDDSAKCFMSQIALRPPTRPIYDDAAFLSAHFKDLGNRAFKSGRYGNAIVIYCESLASRPDAKVYVNKAMAEMREGKTEEACTSAEGAIHLDSEFSKAWFQLAKARHLSNNPCGAQEAIEVAAKLAPQDKEILKLSNLIEESSGIAGVA